MRCLGIDTSNYTTSCALYDADRRRVSASLRRLLPVGEGQVGLRQNDAVYLHVKQLGELLEELLAGNPGEIAAVGVSAAPLDAPGSFMPCFLTGVMAAQGIAAALGKPLYRFSHQAGHLMAALYGVDRLALAGEPFVAFHVSGGTTQCLHVSPDRDRVFRAEQIGATLDLNAGQAVDRVGAMLGLGFPAGPELETLAARSPNSYRPRPAMKGPDCCLSGLENQCRQRLDSGEPPQDVARYCLEFLAETLLAMTREAAARYPGLPLVFAGGVMGNRLIRERVLAEFAASFAPPRFSADNAAGTAILAALRQRDKGEQTHC